MGSISKSDGVIRLARMNIDLSQGVCMCVERGGGALQIVEVLSRRKIAMGALHTILIPRLPWYRSDDVRSRCTEATLYSHCRYNIQA